MQLIAEIGTSHNGSLDHVRRLLDKLAQAGFDCAKFQWVIADEILHPSAGGVDLPGGRIELYERFRQLEQDGTFYARVKEECEQRGLRFLCTVFGPSSLSRLMELAPQAIKIASPELNYVQLLRKAADTVLPIYVSTGVSTLEDIAHANETFGLQADITFLHCVTAYPAPESQYNLACVEPLSRVTGRRWGVSDHTLDPLAVPLTSCALGAHSLEKHVTLDREGGGLDDPIALPPRDFSRMVRTVREVEHSANGLALVQHRLGEERVTAILGSPEKRLAPVERESYGRTNRSLHAKTALDAGTELNEGNLCIVRTERNLRPGIAPRYLETILGARLQHHVSAGEGITWNDVIVRDDVIVRTT